MPPKHSFKELMTVLEGKDSQYSSEICTPFKLSASSITPISRIRLCVTEQFKTDIDSGLFVGMFKFGDDRGEEYLTFGNEAQTVETRTNAFATVLDSWMQRGLFPDAICRAAWRNEMFPVHDESSKDAVFGIERAAAFIFNMRCYGVHCTVYLPSDPPQIWVSKRSMTKERSPGMLDQATAGGLTFGQRPRDIIIKELEEEVGIRPEFSKKSLKRVCKVSVESMTQGAWSAPATVFLYEIELPLDGSFTLKPNDGEVAECNLRSVDDVIYTVLDDQWYDAASASMTAWLVHHNFVNQDNTSSFEMIASMISQFSPEEE